MNRVASAGLLRPDTCSTCGFKYRHGQELQCRRFPPIAHPVMQMTPQGPAIAAMVTAWPVMQPDNWCGEYTKLARNANEAAAA